MAKRVSVQNWLATSARGDFIGAVACVAATDTTWNIDILGNPPASRDPANFRANYAMVDNFNNGASCTFSFGPFSYTVGRYDRRVFAFPQNTTSCSLALSSGQVNVTFAETREILNEASDQFAIQQAANQFVTYTWVTKAAGGNQLATDQNKNLSLINAAAQNYSLLGIAAASIPNGWYNPEVCNDGTGRWSIVPNGADQINSLWTAANPLKLSQGDKIDLGCDGAQWRVKGRASFESAEITMTASATDTQAHGMFKRPSQIKVWLRCKIAELNYAANEEIYLGSPATIVVGGTVAVVPYSVDATNISVVRNPSFAVLAIPNKTTFVVTTITAANWRMFWRAYWDL